MLECQRKIPLDVLFRISLLWRRIFEQIQNASPNRFKCSKSSWINTLENTEIMRWKVVQINENLMNEK